MKAKTEETKKRARPANFFLVPILPVIDLGTLLTSKYWDIYDVSTWPKEYCRESVLFSLD
jgi:hypothetical protein